MPPGISGQTRTHTHGYLGTHTKFRRRDCRVVVVVLSQGERSRGVGESKGEARWGWSESRSARCVVAIVVALQGRRGPRGGVGARAHGRDDERDGAIVTSSSSRRGASEGEMRMRMLPGRRDRAPGPRIDWSIKTNL